MASSRTAHVVVHHAVQAPGNRRFAINRTQRDAVIEDMVYRLVVEAGGDREARAHLRAVVRRANAELHKLGANVELHKLKSAPPLAVSS